MRLLVGPIAIMTVLSAAGAAGALQPPGGGPGRGGMGGPGPMQAERKLLDQFDADKSGWLNDAERAEARKSLAGGAQRGGPRGGFGGPPGMGRNRPAPQPGPHVDPADVPPVSGDLYDPNIVRTIFIDFPNADWEEELEAFYNSDVDVPATITVDGEKYPDTGIHFRGASSYFSLPRGYKRSFNLSLDMVHKDQRLLGYKTLNLLNCNGDPSFLSAILYLQAAREHIPAAKANFVRVVVNGESWGLYASLQQFNKDFLEEHYGSGKGTRWKVSGSPNGRGGLEYLGDDPARYRRIYDIKSADKEESWQQLINLCRVLNETPLDELEEKIAPILDLDSVLWFLALETTFINSDGYWIRASDYNLFCDAAGKFHVIPHDVNEAFQPGGMGPGMGGGPGGFGGPPGFGPPESGPPGFGPPEFGPPGFGPPEFGSDGPPPGERPDFPGGERGRDAAGERPGRPAAGDQEPAPEAARRPARGGGVELDPLVGMNDRTKPLRSRLLAVPSLRQRYLENVRTLARDWLDWNRLGPIVESHARLIEPFLEADTKKLMSMEEFRAMVAQEPKADAGRGGRQRLSLRQFAEARSRYLLNYQPPPENQGDSAAR